MSSLLTIFMVGMALLFVVVTVLVVVAIIKGGKAELTPAGVESIPGRVVEVNVDGEGNHHATLELSSGINATFLVTESQASVMAPGAVGTAHFAGDRLTGWVADAKPIDRYRSE